MSTTCPSHQEWLRLLDGETTENRAAELRAHSVGCSRCAGELDMQRQLLRDLAAPVPVSADAVALVMAGLEKSKPPARRRFDWHTLALASGALAAAAIVTFLFLPSPGGDRGAFGARGHSVPWTRKVGVEVWVIEPSPRKLETGALFSPTTAIVASYHNVDARPAYMFVFALDARGELHWAYPGFEDPKSDPTAFRLEPLQMHKVLSDSVMLDDLPVGPLELVTLITREPIHVSQIESLPMSERSVARLRTRFATARVDSVSLRVAPAPASPSKEKP